MKMIIIIKFFVQGLFLAECSQPEQGNGHKIFVGNKREQPTAHIEDSSLSDWMFSSSPS